jgi:hypothetical protein
MLSESAGAAADAPASGAAEQAAIAAPSTAGSGKQLPRRMLRAELAATLPQRMLRTELPPAARVVEGPPRLVSNGWTLDNSKHTILETTMGRIKVVHADEASRYSGRPTGAAAASSTGAGGGSSSSSSETVSSETVSSEAGGSASAGTAGTAANSASRTIAGSSSSSSGASGASSSTTPPAASAGAADSAAAAAGKPIDAFKRQRIWRDGSYTAYASGLFLGEDGVLVVSYGSGDITSRVKMVTMAQVEVLFQGQPDECL